MMRNATAVLVILFAASVPTLAQERPTTTQEAARPQRTEAAARARAEANRQEREKLRQQSGAPVELIADYVAANVGSVPEALGVSPFYKKHVDALGIPVLASDNVPDAALLVARDIVNTMLAARPDIRKALIARKWRTGVIAEVEMTMDIPEYSRMKRPGAPREEPVTQADRDYHANRSRGLGGNPTTGAEENLLGYPGTRYWGEHIFVHEFAHAMMRGIGDVDPAMHAEIRAAYDSAMAAGKYTYANGRKHYATTNANEYWAEGVQWWFFSNYGECFAGNVKVETPEEFAAYDPWLNALIARVYTTHRIPMDVFHGRRIRPVTCGAAPSTSNPPSRDALRRTGQQPATNPAQERMLQQLREAEAALAAAPDSADALIWVGRRQAYLGRYDDAIATFTRGIAKFPSDARFYRHRGHRYITTRQFAKAIDDFSKAVELIRGKPDEVEPDGQPNARNIPTSTLQTNIWYHLGLAHYLTGNFEAAARAYAEDLKISPNDDNLVAVTHWAYMTARRLGRDAEARRLLEPIRKDLDVIENGSYHRLLLMNKGELTEAELMKAAESGLELATIGYGVGTWHFYNGRREQARAIWKRILETDQKAAFGYIAAEAEMAR